MDIGLRITRDVEQQLGRHFEETERAAGQFLRLHAQVGDMVHGEAEAPFGQRRQAFMFERSEIAISGLREFEHQRVAERAIGFHEIEQLLEAGRVGQRRGADIAEYPDVAALHLQAARDLHAAEHQLIVDLRHQADGFGIFDEVAGRNDVAFLGAQPRQRLVVAHLALRQRDDRLQIKIDTIGVDRLADQLADALAAQAPEAARAGDRVGLAQRQRRIGTGRVRSGVRRQRALSLQGGFMSGHGFGDLPHQGAQFADLGGDRLDHAAHAARTGFDAGFHGVEPAADLSDLAGEIAGAARQIGDLVAEVAAVAQPVADGVVERHAGERGQRHDRGTASVHLESEIEHGTDRAGDEHHADRDEDGADTTHRLKSWTAPRCPRVIRVAWTQ